MNKQELEDLARRCLMEGFPLFKEEHEVYVHMSDEGATVTYRTRPGIPFETTRFDIQFIGPVCFGNHIEIEPKERGKGNGRKLYSVIESIAREYGANKIEGTASGDMPDGRSKTEYMESLGYSRVEKAIGGVENKDTPWVVEKVLN